MSVKWPTIWPDSPISFQFDMWATYSYHTPYVFPITLLNLRIRLWVKSQWSSNVSSSLDAEASIFGMQHAHSETFACRSPPIHSPMACRCDSREQNLGKQWESASCTRFDHDLTMVYRRWLNHDLLVPHDILAMSTGLCVRFFFSMCVWYRRIYVFFRRTVLDADGIVRQLCALYCTQQTWHTYVHKVCTNITYYRP